MDDHTLFVKRISYVCKVNNLTRYFLPQANSIDKIKHVAIYQL